MPRPCLLPKAFRAATLIASLVIAAPAGAADLGPLDLNKDNRITLDEVHRYLAQRHAVRDVSADGEVTYHELVRRFAFTVPPLAPDQARIFITTFDQDGSGSVSLDELIAGINASGIFAMYDWNGNGSLSLTEARGAGLVRARVAQ